ncbi:pyroglutamyl peptidase [Nocardiopsis aegyptia]|uniref:pyroglutamyl peptidase n=1 Tax=Nocardiopsis aegyptia TaxID=220378 RepID=UPI00366D5FD5
MHHHPTPEEERAGLPEPRRILARSGFGAAEPLFTADLRACEDLTQAWGTVSSHASRLWTEAARTGHGALDDRPLYWARLVLAARLRAWRPGFDLSDRERGELLHLWETSSRGIADLDFPPGDRWIRVVATGFDPFHLDEDPECSNPSGAAALDLNGWTFPVGERTAVVRTAVFPVRWADFDAGLVEEALAGRYARADAVITLSRGRPERFDLEVWNGSWRGGGTDNLGLARTGRVPAPGPGAPEWTRSSLPVERVVERARGRYPVVAHTGVTEVPAGGGDPVVRAEGPSPGSSARCGGGGDYLSNEIAYRNTLLSERAERDVPAGHVHVPRTRRPEEHADTLAQIRAIVAAVVG